MGAYELTVKEVYSQGNCKRANTPGSYDIYDEWDTLVVMTTEDTLAISGSSTGIYGSSNNLIYPDMGDYPDALKSATYWTKSPYGYYFSTNSPLTFSEEGVYTFAMRSVYENGSWTNATLTVAVVSPIALEAGHDYILSCKDAYSDGVSGIQSITQSGNSLNVYSKSPFDLADLGIGTDTGDAKVIVNTPEGVANAKNYGKRSKWVEIADKKMPLIVDNRNSTSMPKIYAPCDYMIEYTTDIGADDGEYWRSTQRFIIPKGTELGGKDPQRGLGVYPSVSFSGAIINKNSGKMNGLFVIDCLYSSASQTRYLNPTLYTATSLGGSYTSGDYDLTVYKRVEE